MKNTDEIDGLRPLARVAPGERGADPAGAGGRALLTSIMAEEPGAATAPRPRRGQRTVFGLAAAVALAAGAVVVPTFLGDGSALPKSYAVTRTDDGKVIIQVRDFRDAAGLEQRLKALRVPAIVNGLPSGQMCREPRGKHVKDIPPGLYGVPENIPGETEGWQMRIDTTLFKPGQTFVWTISASDASGDGSSTSTYLMEGPIAPCEPVPAPPPVIREPEYRTATTKGRSLEGFRVDEKTVGEVLPELRKRHKKVEFLIIAIPPGNPGGYGELRTQKAPVGDHWTVWEAEENTKGVIRLLVTEQRYDKNPVYGGPRDDVIKE
ncbi:hypothetical protein [Spongiactinospora sp. TRM90649]|uniref:hypothetical protein n=1 Tax=Spongiactinospora sp. TRM90649 TaxID=3031114 RepID=UPI0023F6D7E7|nr:hypothetical protein [Spongiactinospora sp. TRM90649]MDF5751832.1 hypothetical protein [Spongiactinospora sp. TRM90649]